MTEADAMEFLECHIEMNDKNYTDGKTTKRRGARLNKNP